MGERGTYLFMDNITCRRSLEMSHLNSLEVSLSPLNRREGQNGVNNYEQRRTQSTQSNSGLVSKRIRPKAAAQILGITRRQLYRLRTSFLSKGASGLVSPRRGKPSNRHLPQELKTQVLELIRDRYHDFGPTLAAEKLRELHGIGIGVATLRRWMVAEGIWLNRTARLGRVFQPRYRRECLGELVQIDGSEHWWFEERGPQCTQR